MMDCRTFALLLEKPETEWTQEEQRAAEEHAAHCADCRMLLAMGREMRSMDEAEEVPPSFSSSWREKINTEEKKMNGKILSFPWKRTLAAVAAVAVVAVGTTAALLNNREQTGYTTYATKSSYASESAYESGASYSSRMAAGMGANMVADYAEYEMDAATEDAGSVQEAKIIRTVNFTIRTKEYEADYEAIRQLTAQYGGRIESLSTSGDGTANSLRYASFTLRIPSDKLDEFISGARDVGSVSSYSESSEDVSESYYDMQSRLETQKAKLQRLTEMMAKAKNISDLIELESAITDTQYWIDYYTGKMRGYDSRVSDSYVYVTLRELSTAEPVEVRGLTLGERIENALSGSIEMAGEVLEALVVFLVAALPWIVAGAVLVIVLRVVIRRKKNRKKAKEQ